jgi:hypothetical protein
MLPCLTSSSTWRGASARAVVPSSRCQASQVVAAPPIAAVPSLRATILGHQHSSSLTSGFNSLLSFASTLGKVRRMCWGANLCSSLTLLSSESTSLSAANHRDQGCFIEVVVVGLGYSLPGAGEKEEGKHTVAASILGASVCKWAGLWCVGQPSKVSAARVQSTAVPALAAGDCHRTARCSQREGLRRVVGHVDR